MTAIRRRSAQKVIPAATTLATADDLDGTTDGTQYLTVPGGAVVVVVQIHDGTPGTAGVDVLEESFDGGTTWRACTTLLAASANPFTGTVVASGALNAAGIDTVGGYVFKAGPFHGPTKLRIGRKTTTTGGTTWITGAPTVYALVVGGNA
jgi:hypothetical protein